MKDYDACEQAYRNGYEQGKKDAVKHGTWEPSSYRDCGNQLYRCSVCTAMEYIADFITTRYCPNCGARMDGDNE